MDSFDNDDMVLSQALYWFECREIQFNCENIFQDDLILSQTSNKIEKGDIFHDTELMTSSQMINYVNDVPLEYYCNFELSYTDNLKQEDNQTSDVGASLSSCSKPFGKSVSDSDLDALVQDQRSKITDRNTLWAYNAFEAWWKTRPGIPVLEELDINTHLSRFVVEVRKKNRNFLENLRHKSLPARCAQARNYETDRSSVSCWCETLSETK